MCDNTRYVQVVKKTNLWKNKGNFYGASKEFYGVLKEYLFPFFHKIEEKMRKPERKAWGDDKF